MRIFLKTLLQPNHKSQAVKINQLLFDISCVMAILFFRHPTIRYYLMQCFHFYCKSPNPAWIIGPGIHFIMNKPTLGHHFS